MNNICKAEVAFHLWISKRIEVIELYIYIYLQKEEVSKRKDYVNLATPQDHINLHVRGGYVIPVQEPANNTFFRYTIFFTESSL
jgi:hypothetical protein